MKTSAFPSCLCLAGLGFIGLGASSAFAQSAPAPAPEEVATVPTPASLGKTRLSLDLVPALFGKLDFSSGGTTLSSDAAAAFGVRGVVDYSINDYLFVGFGPQILFNVITKDAPSGSKAEKQIDLSARVGGHAPIADAVHLYGYLAPGYSFVTSDDSKDPKGFSLGVAAGALFSFPGSNFFLNGELGYHMTFLSVSETVLGQSVTADVKTKYPLLAIGAGVKL